MAPSVGGYPVPMGAVEHVVVTGLMGAGKTTVGRELAGRLGWSWRDSDADIEARPARPSASCAIARASTRCTRARPPSSSTRWRRPEPSVISAAASVIDDPAARAAMRAPGVAVIWLHARPDVLAERFDSADEHRPAYGDSPEAFLAEQAARREPLLGEVGAHVIDVDAIDAGRGRRAGARARSASIGS